MEKLAEGKTKIIWGTGHRNVVRVESKDDITAGNGVRHDVIEGKGVFATTTTCNCFKLLWAVGTPNHFGHQADERSFYARKAIMIPVEMVARRVATGSFLKRHPEVLQGSVFPEPVIEFFYKDDSLLDPLLRPATNSGLWNLYDPGQPLSSSSRLPKQITTGDLLCVPVFSPMGPGEWAAITKRTFLTLEAAWACQGVRLLDLKIECGIGPDLSLIVADVLDNDSWRICPRKDKQVYRDLPVVTVEALEEIRANYAWVAEKTQAFTTF
jgi:phosphoribosylaminoimidazole-succinocarboxamide synthase